MHWLVQSSTYVLEVIRSIHSFTLFLSLSLLLLPAVLPSILARCSCLALPFPSLGSSIALHYSQNTAAAAAAAPAPSAAAVGLPGPGL